MSAFRPMTGGTLAALQAAQLLREKQLKENFRATAASNVRTFAVDHKWPEEDTTEVLKALGLDD